MRLNGVDQSISLPGTQVRQRAGIWHFHRSCHFYLFKYAFSLSLAIHLLC